MVSFPMWMVLFLIAVSQVSSSTVSQRQRQQFQAQQPFQRPRPSRPSSITRPTTTGYLGPRDCESSGECYWAPRNNQCFCYLNSTASPKNWAGAQALCRGKGWELPHPTDIVDLRSGLFQYCGNFCGGIWLNAKCSGSQMFWQNPLVEIFPDNIYFATHPTQQPDPAFAQGVCLKVIVTNNAIRANPAKPYFTAYCSNTHPHILCQKYH